MNLNNIKNSAINLVSHYPTISATVAGYGLTTVYTVLNPVGGAIFFGSFAYAQGFKPKTRLFQFYHHGPMLLRTMPTKHFVIEKIKAFAFASLVTVYVTPYANLATGAKVVATCAAGIVTAAKSIASFVHSIFSLIFAAPSNALANAAYVIGGTNLAAVAATIAVVAVVFLAYSAYNAMSSNKVEFSGKERV